MMNKKQGRYREAEKYNTKPAKIGRMGSVLSIQWAV